MTPSREAARIAGVTYRQLDYWIRMGAVEPSTASRGTGTHRAWDSVDVDRLLVLGRLSRLLGGMDHELAETVWHWLGEHDVWPAELQLGRDQRNRWTCHAGVAQAGLWVALTGTSRALRASSEMEGQLSLAEA